MATLEVTFRGLCLFVPDHEARTVHVLMPATDNPRRHWDRSRYPDPDTSRHVAKLLHRALPGAGLPMEGWMLVLGGHSGLADTTLGPAFPSIEDAAIVDLSEFMQAGLDRRLVEDSTNSEIISHVVLRAGYLLLCSAEAEWDLMGRKTALANSAIWRIEDLPEDQLNWIQLYAGSHPPLHSLSDLPPDSDGIFRITISHETADALTDGAHQPGAVMEHFREFYSLFGITHPLSEWLPIFNPRPESTHRPFRRLGISSLLASATLRPASDGVIPRAAFPRGSSERPNLEGSPHTPEPDPAKEESGGPRLPEPPRDSSPQTDEAVYLSGAAPKRVRPGDYFSVDFAAYVKAYEHQVAETLGRDYRPDEIQKDTLAMSPWPAGAQVIVRITAPGLKIDETEQSFVWQGTYCHLEFDVGVPEDAPERRTLIRFEAYIDALRVGKLSLNMEISRAATAAGEKTLVEAEGARRAFVSYSHEDQARVLRAVGLLSPVLRDAQFFVDLVSLRTGGKWEPALEAAIRNCNLFLLFWSSNAQTSDWVKREWTYALDHHGDDILQILLLELVDPNTVPERLRGFQFDNHWLRLSEQVQSA